MSGKIKHKICSECKPNQDSLRGYDYNYTHLTNIEIKLNP